MTPLKALATALAYVIVADDEVAAPEKAQMLATLGKHLHMNTMSELHLKELTREAFKYARHHPFDHYLKEIQGLLSPGQETCIYLNLYDAMLVDGTVTSGEREILDRFRGFAGIDEDVDIAIRQVLMVKNDTGMFLQENHPCNEPGYALRVALTNE